MLYLPCLFYLLLSSWKNPKKRRKTRQLKIDCVLCSRHCSQNKRLRAPSLSLSFLRSCSRHSTSLSLSLHLFSARTPPFRRSRRSSSFREIRLSSREKFEKKKFDETFGRRRRRRRLETTNRRQSDDKMSYSMKRQQKGLFRVYTRKEAEESYKKAIESMTSVLYCEEDLARYLLHAFDAKTNKIHDAYFGDEERTKRKLGVLTEEEEKEAEKNNVLRLAMEEKEKKTCERALPFLLLLLLLLLLLRSRNDIHFIKRVSRTIWKPCGSF